MVLSAGTICSDHEGVTYYVKPSQSSQCPGQPCETLQYYLSDNVNTTLNQQKNITMIFLTGNHTVNSTDADCIITVPVIRLIGESSEDVAVLYAGANAVSQLIFSNNTLLVFKNLKLIMWFIEIQESKQTNFQMSSVVLLNCWIETVLYDYGIFNVENSASKGGLWTVTTYSEFVLTNCTFHEMTFFDIDSFDIRIRDCTFVNTPVSTGSSIILSGDTVFKDTTKGSAIYSDQGNITLSRNISFVNNSALRGGAIALFSSTLNIAANTVVTFINNTATQFGGAIYVTPGIVPSMVLNSNFNPHCFYQLLNCSTTSTYNFVFEGNSAAYGGDDIYGVSLIESDCSYNTPYCNLTINRSSSSNSSISSDPLHVCICDSNGKPQCENNSYTFMSYSVHPGEIFTLSFVVVGGDFGLTIGTVYANIFQSTYIDYFTTPLLIPDQAVTNISTCTEVDYHLYSQNNSYVIVFLATTVLIDPNQYINPLDKYNWCNVNDLSCFLITPIFINFTILPCPSGFTLLNNPPQCDCYPILTNTLNITCHIVNKTGYFSWAGDLWINIDSKIIIYNEYCPYNYCKKGGKEIDLLKNSNSQCDFNRAGRLCGECKDGYSLAIGSSNCILCQTNNNLALIIFFAAAGFLLVFFIGILNITITQGAINGLIFYANIVWTYKDIFFTFEGSKMSYYYF